LTAVPPSFILSCKHSFRLLRFALTPPEGIPTRILYSDNHRLSLSYHNLHLQLQQLSHLSPQRDSTTTWHTIPAIHLYSIAHPHTTTNMSPKPSPSIRTLLATLLFTIPALAQTTYVQGTFQAAISASSNGQPDLTSAASAVCPANFPQSCSSIGEAGLYVSLHYPNNNPPTIPTDIHLPAAAQPAPSANTPPTSKSAAAPPSPVSAAAHYPAATPTKQHRNTSRQRSRQQFTNRKILPTPAERWS
jgi:hypothetical protein